MQNDYTAIQEEKVPENTVNRELIKEQRIYAGFFVRLAAYLLDRVILCLPLLLVRLLMGISTWGGLSFLKRDVLFSFTPADIILYVCTVAYFIILTWLTGRTIGKRIMRIRVVSKEGRKPSLFEILFRETVGRFLSSVILCIGYLIIAAGSEKEALHDYLADTRVVYE